MKQLDITGISRRDLLLEGISERFNNINEFCRESGLDYGAIYRYIHNNVRISDKVARKLESALNKPAGYLDQKIPSIATVQIPVIGVNLNNLSLSEALAGSSTFSGIDRSTLLNFGWEAENLFIVIINDNSMEPVIKDKAEIIVDKSKLIVENNKIYAIRVKSIIMIRKIFQSPLSNSIKLIPENDDDFPIEEISTKDPNYEILGKVIYLKAAL